MAEVRYINAHSAHCCPKHGCKYGEATCPIVVDGEEPFYPNNNGCEVCEGLPSQRDAALSVLGVVEVYSYGWKRHTDGSLVVSGTCNSRDVAQYKADEYNAWLAEREPNAKRHYVVVKRYISEWTEVEIDRG